jgi:hypothetical protein
VQLKQGCLHDYFSHYKAKECAGGYESALHKMGKQIIMDAGWIMFPSRSVEITSLIDGDHFKKSFVDYKCHRTELFDIVPESKVDRWRPDLVATLKTGARVFIEIKVTHRVEEPKALELDNLMEIDLWGLQPEEIRDIDRIKRRVLDTAPRNWYLCSLYDDLERVRKAQAELDKSAATLRSQHQQRVRREALKESKRQEYANHVKKAKAMTEESRQNAMHAQMQIKALPAIQAACQRLNEAGHC